MLDLNANSYSEFTLLVEDRVLNELLTDSEVAGELNRFLKVHTDSLLLFWHLITEL